MKKILQNLSNSVSSSSLASRLRKKRFKLFLKLVKSIPNETITILDIGGWERYWVIQEFVNTKNNIIILNLSKFNTHYPNITSVLGDARDLSQFADKSINIVFSNSVIEHLGTYNSQLKMANEVRRVGKMYYVQTPSYYFPMEPHFLFPFFHWLPISIRVFLVRNFSLGWYQQAGSAEKALEMVKEIRLLKKSELKKLFPDAVIIAEKLLGLTKSYIIIKK